MHTPFQDAEANEQLYIVNAYLESDEIILVALTHPPTFPFTTSDATITDVTSAQSIPVLAIEDAQLPSSSSNARTDLLQITLAQIPDVTHVLHVKLQGYHPCNVIPRNVLNSAAYSYNGHDLGNSFTPQATSFRVWAPTASMMEILLYNSEDGPQSEQIAMQRSTQGTWHAHVEKNLEHWYYLYQVTVHGNTQIAVDPYVKALTVNATRGMIVNLHKTNPAGWEADSYVHLANAVDAVIYEVHVRDFSSGAHSGMAHKGQYLAFTEHGTSGPDSVSTGVDSLKQLGVSHVQILPVAAFASVDENYPEQYNWGYDPRNYNVPEGAYASTPHGTARISEYKQMIQSLHRSSLGVIMDVVYNHTFATPLTSDFDKLVPQYYYRTNNRGDYTNGSGVGNEIAAERPMVQKFIRDSLKYWAQEYHVDGFRFDLMALLSVDTMTRISQDVHAINPYALLYGEPWAGGNSALPFEQLLTKGKQKSRDVSVFNDIIRNGLIGSVFDAHAQGFATGASEQMDAVKKGVLGSITDFAAAPHETINYVSCHDNLTLWDKITASHPSTSEEQRIKMDELAQAVILTSQGIAFLQGGEEFLRSKGGNDNSYRAGDAINQFDWSRKASYKDVFDYYAGLIHLRNNHPAFRMTTEDQINQYLLLLAAPANMVAFQLRDHANGDRWKHILVLYNPNSADETFTLPQGQWTVVATQGQVKENGLGQVVGIVKVPGIACMILYQN